MRVPVIIIVLLGSIVRLGCADQRFYSEMLTAPQPPPLTTETLRDALFTYNHSQLQHIDTWDVSAVTDMSYLFDGTPNFNQPIGNWNVSAVTSMEGMFRHQKEFNQPIGAWNTARVTSMRSMFKQRRKQSSKFNQPIGNWSTAKVTDMSYMFKYHYYINQPIESWDISSVTSMEGMFQKAKKFNGEIRNWNTSRVTRFDNMFKAAKTFSKAVANWDTSRATSMTSMFYNAGTFNKPIGNWDTSRVTNFDNMFRAAKNFNQPIDNWDTSKCTSMNSMFYNAATFNQPIGNWDTSFVTDMSTMFFQAYKFNQPISKWNFDAVVAERAQSIFFKATEFAQPMCSLNATAFASMCEEAASKCKQGQFFTAQYCKDCDHGQGPNQARTACVLCMKGKYSIRGKGCSICDAGFHAAADGMSMCTACSGGTFSEEGASKCGTCPAGTVSEYASSTCTPCGAGYHVTTEGDSTCTACSSGTFSEDGASKCDICPAGTASEYASSSCKPCGAGYYSAAAGNSACTACSSGTFSEKGASKCDTCPSGTISEYGSSRCTPCPIGSFTISSDAAECLPCLAGTYADKTGASACKQCPFGSIQPAENQAACVCKVGFFKSGNATRGPETTLPCTRCESVVRGSTTEFHATVSVDKCLCPAGTYFRQDERTCETCTTGLSCPSLGKGPPMQDASYSVGEMIDGKLTYVKRCENELRCPGNTPLGSCPPNRKGLACNVCHIGYFEDEMGACINCDEQNNTTVPFVVSLMVSIVFALCLAFALLKEHNTYSQSLATVTIGVGIIFNTLQALSAFSELSIEWVEPMIFMGNLFKILSLNIKFLNPDCVFKVSESWGSYLGSLLVYPAFVAVTMIVFGVARHISTTGERITINRVLNLEGLILLTLYLSLCLMTLLPWQCWKNPDQTYSLLMDRNVQCFEGGDHTIMLILSVLGLVIYGFGFAALIVWATLKYPVRVAIDGGMDFVEKFAFVFSRFRPECYYFPPVYILRSFSFALIPVVFVREPSSQVMILAMVVVAFAFAQVRLLPWNTKAANSFDAYANATLVVVLMAGAILMPGDSESSTLQILLLIVVVAPFVYGAAMAAWSLFKYLVPPITYGMFLCHHKADAAVLCRWFQLSANEMISDKVFLDSDHLDDLDLLFDVVAYETKNIVPMLTQEILYRMWCAGELCCAVRANINIIPVACDGYLPPSNDFVANLEDIWTPAQKTELAGLGVTITGIQTAIQAVVTLPTVVLKRREPQDVQMKAVAEVVSKGVKLNKLIGKVHESGMGNVYSIGQVTNAKVIITGHLTDPEGLCVCHVLQKLLQKKMQRAFALTDSDQFPPAMFIEACYFLVVLFNGILGNPSFASCLVQGSHLPCVPIMADQSFAFPDPQFWSNFDSGQILNPADLQVKPFGLEKIADTYKKLLHVLAVRFTSHGSRHIQDAEVSQLASRQLNFTADGKAANKRLASLPCNFNFPAFPEGIASSDMQEAIGKKMDIMV